jgi:uncharacterized membrane protein
VETIITVTLYFQPDSPACDQVKADLAALRESLPHQLVQIDISKDESLRNVYDGRVPVVQVGPYKLEGNISRERLMVALGAARDRVNQLEKVDQKAYQDRLAKGHEFTSTDRISIWIADNYIHIFNIILLIYFGLPFLAPILMKEGDAGPGELIYKIYSPMCHQLAYRSWFLFGEQPFYPRALAGVPGVISYEAATGLDSRDVVAGRAFLGNQTLGYKVALCERDVAIYASMFLFGIVFWLSKRKIRSLPWYLWIVIGIIPIGVDGFSQLPSVLTWLPQWLPIRESTPFLRTVTGGLFGVMTAWYLYPLIEESMRETRRLMLRKQAIASQAIND